MGKALEEIERVFEELGRYQELGISREEKVMLSLITRSQKSVIIALEDIAKAIREK